MLLKVGKVLATLLLAMFVMSIAGAAAWSENGPADTKSLSNGGSLSLSDINKLPGFQGMKAADSLVPMVVKITPLNIDAKQGRGVLQNRPDNSVKARVSIKFMAPNGFKGGQIAFITTGFYGSIINIETAAVSQGARNYRNIVNLEKGQKLFVVLTGRENKINVGSEWWNNLPNNKKIFGAVSLTPVFGWEKTLTVSQLKADRPAPPPRTIGGHLK